MGGSRVHSGICALAFVLAGTACRTEQAGGGDGGVRCNPGLAHVADWKSADGTALPSPSAWAWTGAEVVAVAHADASTTIMAMDPMGATPMRVGSLWPGTPAIGTLAVSSGVLAIVGARYVDSGAERSYCGLALARIEPIESIRAPTRFSDSPEADGHLNSVRQCDVAAVSDGFVLVWQQSVSATGDSARVFAQAIGLDGEARGDRLTIADGTWGRAAYSSVASDGTRVAITLSDDGRTTEFAFIEGDTVRKVPFDSGDPSTYVLRLSAAHGGFVASDGSRVWRVDSAGKTRAGPVEFEKLAEFGPLGDRYVAIEDEQYLTARTFDTGFGDASKRLELSRDRNADSHGLIGDMDGATTIVPYYADGGERLAVLACADESPPSVGAQKCKTQSALMPLDDGCSEEVCHIALRFDFRTLGVLGWSVAGGAKQELDADEARAIATAEFEKRSPPIRTQATLEGPNAGLYSAYAAPADFGAFALVGAQSGSLAFAGSVLWSGPGKAWGDWRPAQEVACGSTAAQPAETFITMNAACSAESKAPTAADALDAALRTNLARGIAKRGPFSAAVHLYRASEGSCVHSDLSEYVVVFTQLRDR